MRWFEETDTISWNIKGDCSWVNIKKWRLLKKVSKSIKGNENGSSKHYNLNSTTSKAIQSQLLWWKNSDHDKKVKKVESKKSLVVSIFGNIKILKGI